MPSHPDGSGKAGGGTGAGNGAGPGDELSARRGGLSAARRYTPRGRSVRETADPDRSGRGDPFRPALRVVDGGERRAARTARRMPADGGSPPRRGAVTTADPERTGRKPKTATRRASVDRGRQRQKAPANPPRQAKRPQRKPRKKPPRLPRLGDPIRRLRVATVLTFVVFTVIAGRLVQIQVTDAKAYAHQGLIDRLKSIELPAPRGTIYDRDGAILVHSVDARHVFADPTQVKDPEATATKLFEVLGKVGVTRSDILARIKPHKLSDGQAAQFEYLARGIDVSLGEEVEALGLPGIDTGRDERRDVPNHDLAANVLGFTRKSDGVGLAGIEAGYNTVLKGVDGKRTFEVGESNLAREIPGGYSQTTPAQPGSSLQLTIDRDLQHTVQSIVTQRAQQVQATFACGLVLDIKTFEVLAQASYPTYDAADPFDTPETQRRDACTEKVYDPGSVHKALVVGAALEEGIVEPATAVIVGPSVKKGGTVYTDHIRQKSGTAMTLPGILALSSNVGTIAIADQLGKERLVEYQRRFGLGAATGEGLPNESPGKVLPAGEWTGTSYGSIPIGDGVAVTALQMAAAFATIANDGLWIQPHLVRATIGADGKKKGNQPLPARQVISAGHAAELRTMLEAVTTLDNATGRSAAIEGYRIAGKTGTGLYVQNGKYAAGNVASFIGLAPADAPRYVVAINAHAPSGTGGTICGPAFHDIMSFVLGKYQVPPTGTTPPTFTVYP
ncbi:MAG: penicillin-binding protein 2 [Micromonosporaceae bacterium]|nr:penicillin-binding protein 2 [Micromonosporaceae bacterium]